MPPSLGAFSYLGFAVKRYQKYLSLLLVFVAFNSNALQCGAGHVEVDGVCVSSCTILKGTSKSLTYDSYIWGDSPTSFCNGDRSTGAACFMSASPVSISVEGTMWTNSFTYSGATCNFDEINRFFGDTPSPSPYEDDINFNGIPDSEEDWDGDGIKNSEDPNPTQNDNLNPDEDGNGVPDNLDNFYESIGNNTPEYVRCSDSDPDCSTYKGTIYDLSINNRELSETIRHMSFNSVTNDGLESSLKNLSKGIYQQHQFTRNDIQLNRALIQAKNTGGVDNSGIINSGFSTMSTEFKEIDSLFSQTLNRFDDVDYDLGSIERSVNSLPGQLNGIHGHLDATQSDIIDAINNNGGGSGLTSTQQNQLKNAAKASANQKLIKNMQSSVDFVAEGFGMLYSDVTDSIDSLNPKFQQLSDQISAISSGSSTVDLSGVESSIESLSTKIDGLESGDMSGVESKLTDLIDSVTNNNNFVEPSSSFNGEGFIVTPDQIAEVQNEVIEIKQEMTDEFEKFKALFSIDTSSFNNGTYKEHSLNLNVNHAERSFKSGVLSALLDNATLISAVVMFLFVLSGIRMLGKD
ncbi:hypothetical protein [Vibrio coralliirubri]|uniref:hypothetical protein n=1 Tax=Vibrio coralliirubri TaxID=1516159 RepID=UPI0013DD39E4|nr:hypothetical protein [Vibrio coralliirubri]